MSGAASWVGRDPVGHTGDPASEGATSPSAMYTAGMCVRWTGALLLLAALASATTETADASPARKPVGELRVRFFSAGHGDSTLLRTPAGHNILIDLGRGSKKHLGDNLVKRRLLPFVKREGIRRLDAVIVTHAHWDHFGDLGRLRTGVRFDRIIVSRFTARSFRRMRGLAHHRRHWLLRLFRHPGHDNLRYDVVARGGHYRLGGLTLEVLWPPDHRKTPSAVGGIRSHNNQSLVIRARYGKIRFLLTGDLETAGERRMLRSHATAPGRADVLKLGHHGSRSTSAAFLDRVRPRYAVATVGDEGPGREDRLSARILRDLRRRRVKLLRSDRDGDVVFHTDGRRLRVQTLPELRYVPGWLAAKRARLAVLRKQRRQRHRLLAGLAVTFLLLLAVLGARIRRRHRRRDRS